MGKSGAERRLVGTLYEVSVTIRKEKGLTVPRMMQALRRKADVLGEGERPVLPDVGAAEVLELAAGRLWFEFELLPLVGPQGDITTAVVRAVSIVRGCCEVHGAPDVDVVQVDATIARVLT